MIRETELIKELATQKRTGACRLAKLARLRKSTVIDIFQDRVEPRIATLKILAETLGAKFVIEQQSIASGRVTRHEAEQLPKVLREIRRAAGLRQVELAEKSGIGQTLISDYEVGRHVPSLTQLRRIADACGCRLNGRVETFS